MVLTTLAVASLSFDRNGFDLTMSENLTTGQGTDEWDDPDIHLLRLNGFHLSCYTEKNDPGSFFLYYFLSL